MAGPRYQADPPSERLIVALDELDLIYHRPSGMTHVVAEPVPQILASLAEGAASAGEIVTRLAASHDINTEGAEAVIAARLDELEAIGLVWRA